MAEEEFADNEYVQEGWQPFWKNRPQTTIMKYQEGKRSRYVQRRGCRPDIPRKRRDSPKRDHSPKGEAQGLSAVDS
jgi:hypothetical protein